MKGIGCKIKSWLFLSLTILIIALLITGCGGGGGGSSDGSYDDPTTTPTYSPTPTSTSTPVPTASPTSTSTTTPTPTPTSTTQWDTLVEGRVTDSNGSPVSGATVSDGRKASATTNSNGEYSIRGVEPGACTLTVTKSGYVFKTISIQVTEGETVTAPTIVITESGGSSQEKEWTFLVYIAADNNLENMAFLDINEMEKVGSDDNINIVVQVDAAGVYIPGLAGSYRLYITKDTDTSSISSTIVENMGSTDSGSPDTLKSFMQWGIQNYPAKKYAIVLWNHGSGWKLKTGGDLTKGICYDDSSNSHINQAELKQALSGAGKKFNLLAMDACLMGTVEVAYDIKDHASYFTASEASVPGNGFPYDTLLTSLSGNPGCDGKTLGGYMVSAYAQEYSSSSNVSLSTISLVQMETLITAINSFIERGNQVMAAEQATLDTAIQSTVAVDSSYDDYKDVGDLMTAVEGNVSDEELKTRAAAVRSALTGIITSETHSSGRSYTGLTIWAPTRADYDRFAASHSQLGFSSACTWNQFLDQAISQ